MLLDHSEIDVSSPLIEQSYEQPYIEYNDEDSLEFSIQDSKFKQNQLLKVAEKFFKQKAIQLYVSYLYVILKLIGVNQFYLIKKYELSQQNILVNKYQFWSLIVDIGVYFINIFIQKQINTFQIICIVIEQFVISFIENNQRDFFSKLIVAFQLICLIVLYTILLFKKQITLLKINPLRDTQFCILVQMMTFYLLQGYPDYQLVLFDIVISYQLTASMFIFTIGTSLHSFMLIRDFRNTFNDLKKQYKLFILAYSYILYTIYLLFKFQDNLQFYQDILHQIDNQNNSTKNHTILLLEKLNTSFMISLLVYFIYYIFVYHLIRRLLIVFLQLQGSSIVVQNLKRAIDLNVLVQKNSHLLKKPSNSVQKEETNNSLECCYICMDKPSNIYLKPCRHTGLCQDCFLKHIWGSQLCPICKQQIKVAYQFHQENGLVSKKRFALNAL